MQSLNNNFLGTYNKDRLKEHLSNSKKVPELKKVLPVNRQSGSNNSQEIELKFKAVTVSFKIRDLFRNWTYPQNLNSAVARWLQPEALGLDDIDRLRWESKLDYLDTKSFVLALKDACKEVGIQDEPLKLWIFNRTSLLDYLLFPPSGQSTDLLEADLKLGILLNRARGFLELDPVRVREYAKKTLAQALESAANATSRILGPKPEDSQVWANLMVPINKDQLQSTFFSQGTGVNENINRARKLWQHTPQQASKVLVVVAETNEENNHFGFWVPVYDRGSLVLPGAPTAFVKCEGSAVFKDDLPHLINFCHEQNQAFQNYMNFHFKESLFVSLPLTLESSANNRRVVAVLNVNVIPRSPDSWRRAYHLEWLREATKQVKSSLCQAYEAFQLICDTLNEGEQLLLDPVFPDLLLLPRTQTPKLITGDTHDTGIEGK